MKDIDLKVFREAWLDLVRCINDQEIELQEIEFHRVGCHPVQYGSYYCEVCKYRWVGVKGSHVCQQFRDALHTWVEKMNAYQPSLLTKEIAEAIEAGREAARQAFPPRLTQSYAMSLMTPQTPEQKEEAYLRWAREFKPEWLPAAMAEADAEQKEQSDACIKHYLDGLHAQLFDALTQTRNEQSKDIQAKRVIDILLAQRMGK